MTHTFRATYDGECLHPTEPLPIAPNTEIVLSYEGGGERKPARPGTYMDVALSSRVEGPPDWSERVDHYLYGGMADDEE